MTEEEKDNARWIVHHIKREMCYLDVEDLSGSKRILRNIHTDIHDFGELTKDHH